MPGKAIRTLMNTRLLWGQLLLLLTMLACAPEALERNLETENSNSSFVPPETFNGADSSVNYIKFGATTNASSINYPIDLDDSYQFFGNQIDNYITQLEVPMDQNFCLLTRYASAPNDCLRREAALASL